MNLDQFKDWAIQQGQVSNPTGRQEWLYAGECVSLIQQYLDKVYGIPFQPRGHAKDWITNGNVLSYFDIVGNPQAGDIGVTGPVTGNPYGHIFIYLSPTTILEQNGRVSRRVSVGAAYQGATVLRHKGQGGDSMVIGQQDKLIKGMLGREPSPAELNDPMWRSNPGLAIDTLWENGGKQRFAEANKPKGYEPVKEQLYRKV